MGARKLALGIGLSLGLGIASGVVSTPAYAQSNASTSYPSCTGRTVSQSESDAAHTIYLAGRVQYDDSNWDAAIAQFREAYRRDCTKHELLVIISRAYESKGDKQEAINALQTYLERVPANSPDAPALRTRLENIKRQLAEEQKKKEQAAAAAAAATPPPSSTATTTTMPPPATERREHSVLPWVVVGVGGAAVVAGAVLLLAAPAMPPACDESTGNCTYPPGVNSSNATQRQRDDFDQDRETAGRAVGMKQGGTIALIGGGVLVVGGLVWHFLEPTGSVETGTPTAKRPKITPAVGPSFAGVSLGGSF